MERTVIVPSNVYSQMVKEQKALIDKYIVIEGLPTYPLDLQTKKSQSLVKDFVRRFVEELGEAYTELMDIYTSMDANNPKLAEAHLEAFNKEIADAWHFLIEIMIYSGLESSELDSAIQKLFEVSEYFELWEPSLPLKSIFNYVNFKFGDEINAMNNKASNFMVIKTQEALSKPWLAGGRFISQELLQEHATYMWAITHEIMMVANLLKNRDWNQGHRETNLIAYNEGMLGVLITMCRYMLFCGITQVPLFTSFSLKTDYLNNRIENKY